MNITSSELSRLQGLNHKPRTLSALIDRTRKGKILFALPFPPSVNDYWGKTKRGFVFLKPAARKYKKAVELVLTRSGFGVYPTKDKVSLKIVSHKSDARRYDIDNLLKALLDSMKGRVFVDDFDVDEITIKRGEIDRDNPRVEIEVMRIASE